MEHRAERRRWCSHERLASWYCGGACGRLVPGRDGRQFGPLHLADGATAELDVYVDIGDCLEARGCGGEGRGEGNVEQGSLGLPERTAAERLHRETARRRGDEWRRRRAGGRLQAATRVGRERTGDGEMMRRWRVGGRPQASARASSHAGATASRPPANSAGYPHPSREACRGRRKVWKLRFLPELK